MGLDEAGKGCVIGPLVIGAVVWNNDYLPDLDKFDVLDSKVYTSHKQRNQRKKLAGQISKSATKSMIKVLNPNEIDNAIFENRRTKNKSKINLNTIEIAKIAEIISSNPCKTIYIDSLGTPPYFTQTLKEILEKDFSEKIKEIKLNSTKNQLIIEWILKNTTLKQISTVIAENKADSKYKIVSASSIVAKVFRDEQIKLIESNHNLPDGILASGYANDQLKPFLKKYELEIKNKKFDFIRYQWSWEPLQSILRPKKGSLLKYT
jgi:ribonuclease HII